MSSSSFSHTVPWCRFLGFRALTEYKEGGLHSVNNFERPKLRIHPRAGEWISLEQFLTEQQPRVARRNALARAWADRPKPAGSAEQGSSESSSHNQSVGYRTSAVKHSRPPVESELAELKWQQHQALKAQRSPWRRRGPRPGIEDELKRLQSVQQDARLRQHQLLDEMEAARAEMAALLAQP